MAYPKTASNIILMSSRIFSVLRNFIEIDNESKNAPSAPFSSINYLIRLNLLLELTCTLTHFYSLGASYCVFKLFSSYYSLTFSSSWETKIYTLPPFPTIVIFSYLPSSSYLMEAEVLRIWLSFYASYSASPLA